MTKVAVCFSGEPRFFKQSHHFFTESFRGMEVDYFIHAWYHPQHIGEELIPESGPMHKNGWVVEPDTDEKLIDLFSPKKCIFEKQKLFVPKLDFRQKMATTQSPKNMMSMLYSRKKVGELLTSYMEETNTTYEWVFFTRTDVALKRNIESEIKNIESHIILTAHVPGEMWNKTDINDPFVGSDYENMKHWSTLYDHYEHHWLNGVHFCAHRLAFHHMNLLEKPFKQILDPQGTAWAFIRADGLKTF